MTFCVLLFISVQQNTATAATNNSNVVISQIQIASAGSGNANHDFIELFNPTTSTINLSGFKLVSRTASGSTDNSIVNFGSGDVISAWSYYLWCNASIAGGFTCDKSTHPFIPHS